MARRVYPRLDPVMNFRAEKAPGLALAVAQRVSGDLIVTCHLLHCPVLELEHVRNLDIIYEVFRDKRHVRLTNCCVHFCYLAGPSRGLGDTWTYLVLLWVSLVTEAFEPNASSRHLWAKRVLCTVASILDRDASYSLQNALPTNSGSEILADMQGSGDEYRQLAKALAGPGNLFLLLTLKELRRQGLTPTAFFALQQTVDAGLCSERYLRKATGLPDYEVSRASRMLEKSELVTIGRSKDDKRVRQLSPTRRGVRVRDRVLSEAGKVLEEYFAGPEYRRHMLKAAEVFRLADQTLYGTFQVPFEGILPEPEAPVRKRRRKVKGAEGPFERREAS